MFGGQEVEGEVVEEEGKVTSILTLDLERDDMGKILLCKVLHEALREELAAQMEVDVLVPIVSVEMDKSALEGKEGETLELVCRAFESRPAAVITWTLPHEVEYTAEQEAELLQDGSFNTVSTILITSRAEDDGMVVTCQATNEVMEEAKEVSEEISVLYSPRVSMAQEDEILIAGEALTLTCEVHANPANLTKVIWYKDSELVEGDRFVVEDTELVIQEVAAEDAGEYR